jgi:hypothetical protein
MENWNVNEILNQRMDVRSRKLGSRERTLFNRVREGRLAVANSEEGRELILARTCAL